MRELAGLVVLITIAACARSADSKHRYPAFDVSLHDDPKISFHYSAGDATSASPIAITAVSGKITSKDRHFFSGLRANWLSSHVGSELHFVGFGTAVCEFQIDEDPPYCDVVEFENDKTKESAVFYFYEGNWPFE
jgi:hypothetical protein